jgi:hypothetical protein
MDEGLARPADNAIEDRKRGPNPVGAGVCLELGDEGRDGVLSGVEELLPARLLELLPTLALRTKRLPKGSPQPAALRQLGYPG